MDFVAATELQIQEDDVRAWTFHLIGAVAGYAACGIAAPVQTEAAASAKPVQRAPLFAHEEPDGHLYSIVRTIDGQREIFYFERCFITRWSDSALTNQNLINLVNVDLSDDHITSCQPISDSFPLSMPQLGDDIDRAFNVILKTKLKKLTNDAFKTDAFILGLAEYSSVVMIAVDKIAGRGRTNRGLFGVLGFGLQGVTLSLSAVALVNWSRAPVITIGKAMQNYVPRTPSAADLPASYFGQTVKPFEVFNAFAEAISEASDQVHRKKFEA